MATLRGLVSLCLFLLLSSEADSFRHLPPPTKSVARLSHPARLADFRQQHRKQSSPRSSLTRLEARFSPSATLANSDLRVGTNIGSGSYGTVYTVHVSRPPTRGEKSDRTQGSEEECVGKRGWSLADIQKILPEKSLEDQKEKHKRCQYYWKVEKHCFECLPPHPSIPPFQGTLKDDDGSEWLVFKKISATSEERAAPTMQDLFELDLEDHQEEPEHRLLNLSKALGVSPAGPGDTEYLALATDRVIEQTLEALTHIHKEEIVHRDLKPGNLLVANGKVCLIDFGSAASLKTAGIMKANIGISDFVAISPVYAAPELFLNPSLPRSAVNFDCFSAALIFCQIIFQYLDERTDAGFFQQLAAADYSLDTWLQTELSEDVRSAGLEQGLAVLAQRPGLWSLLQGMLQKDPRDRTSSKVTLQKWRELVQQAETGSSAGAHATMDGDFLAEVLESLDLCFISDTDDDGAFPIVRPLHYVATFRRSQPLGLMLAESDADPTETMTENDLQMWQSIQEEDLSGRVYVQGVVPGSQADELGIFEVGDCLQGVGELPVAEGGFERALELLKDQPARSKFITLHLDRRSTSPDESSSGLPLSNVRSVSIIRDQGAWSNRGRRSSQEDRFVLHEIHDTQERSILLAGVFDGHLGTAASEHCHDRLPLRLTELIVEENSRILSLDAMVKQAWDDICREYRSLCSVGGDCVAQYDPREGRLDAYTGGEDAVAGTTASFIAFEQSQGILSVLNCGDSRCLLIDQLGKVVFRTKDHSPEYEIERFSQGIRDGLPYNPPECSFSKWKVVVGDYNYAVSRSLEGPFATSKGVISTPDVSLREIAPGTIAVIASDGLWEVMDVNEVAKILHKVRKTNMGAGDASKTLCSMALEKGSSDNVSAVVVYVE
jgi:serine/threonine protein phosphatase PrpC/serine/threonine protein kinase